MAEKLSSRLKRAWNVFRGQETYLPNGGGSYYRNDHRRMRTGTERSTVTAILNRIALDVAAVSIRHVQLDENERFLSVIESGLNNCFSLEANIDQTARSFVQDVCMSMMDEGSVALVPVDVDYDDESGKMEIETMRTGKITQWYPKDVSVRLYNEETGRQEEITIPKSSAAIIENPLYAIMNEPNSTMRRLVRKLNILDAIDEQSGSGKLDLIIQLPYVVKTQARRDQADQRRKDIEQQLTGSKYGIAYTDGSEKITQLNRPVENNLMSQIEYLTSMLYSQLGITQGVMDGTADEKTQTNYENRTIEPFVAAIVDECKRKFLTKEARQNKESIMYFQDPFKLVPVSQLAEIADKFTRNEIMTSNEFRQEIGMKPSKDPRADQLINKNINHPDEGKVQEPLSDEPDGKPTKHKEENQNG